MKIVSIIFIITLFVSCSSSNTPKLKGKMSSVYDSIALDYCKCFNEDTSLSFDSNNSKCEEVSLRKYYNHLKKIGYDSSKSDFENLEIEKIIFEEVFLNRVDKDCYSYHLQNRKRIEEYSSENNMSTLFLGKFVRQEKLKDGWFKVTLKEQNFNETKVFLSKRKINIENWQNNLDELNIILKYKIDSLNGENVNIVKEILNPYDN